MSGELQKHVLEVGQLGTELRHVHPVLGEALDDVEAEKLAKLKQLRAMAGVGR